MTPKIKKQLQEPQSQWTTSSPSPRRKERKKIVRFIDTYFIEATQASFKSVVQALTAMNSHSYQIPVSESTYLYSNDNMSVSQSKSRPAKNVGLLQAADDGNVSRAREYEVEGEDHVQMALDFFEFEKIGGWTQNYSGDDILLTPDNEHVLGFSWLKPQEEDLVMWDWLWADEDRRNGDL